MGAENIRLTHRVFEYNYNLSMLKLEKIKLRGHFENNSGDTILNITVYYIAKNRNSETLYVHP